MCKRPKIYTTGESVKISSIASVKKAHPPIDWLGFNPPIGFWGAPGPEPWLK